MRNQCGPNDLARGHSFGFGNEAPSCRRLRGSGGVAISHQRIFTVFTSKTLVLAQFLIEIGRTGPCSECSHYHSGPAVSAVTFIVSKIPKYFSILCLKAEAWLKQMKGGCNYC